MKGNEVGALTGIRGAAAIWVMFYHFWLTVLNRPPTTQFQFGTLMGHGYLAVDLFFILSGFVMALSYGHYFKNGFSFERYGVFAVRRVARIYPLYLAVTLLALGELLHYVGLTYVLSYDKREVVSSVLMLQGWGISNSLIATGWSVSVEVAAYILFPLLISISIYSVRRLSILFAFTCLIDLLAVSVSFNSVEYKQVGPLDVHSVECVNES